jgi:hypothetical protein
LIHKKKSSLIRENQSNENLSFPNLTIAVKLYITQEITHNTRRVINDYIVLEKSMGMWSEDNDKFN